jgi:hypothetical protein
LKDKFWNWLHGEGQGCLSNLRYVSNCKKRDLDRALLHSLLLFYYFIDYEEKKRKSFDKFFNYLYCIRGNISYNTNENG